MKPEDRWPAFKGGQGRSNDDVREDGFWGWMIAVAGLIAVLFWTLLWIVGGGQ